jgi:hypothetical protein
MVTVTAFPILKSLDVKPQTVYDFIKMGIECERVKMQSMQVLGNDTEYYRSLNRIMEADLLLRFMRINGAPHEIVDDII